jgi:cytochrome c-type biogenesis protein CcmH
VLMALCAGGLYLAIGSPGIPDEPAASRTDAAKPGAGKPGGHADFARAAAELEAKLKNEPDNADRWLLYARTVSELSQWDKAIAAYEHVMRLEPNQPDIMAAYGEMLVMAAQGIVTPKAHDVFVQVGRLDPKETVSRFYIALADLQAGESRSAIAAWQKLAADLPKSSSMREEVVRRITQSAADAGLAVPTIPPPGPEPAAAPPTAAAGAPPGPNADAVAAAANMTPEQRKAMISGMVAQLAQKLQDKPEDADGWLRLGRAYMVLAETDKAEDAFNHAAKLRPGDTSIQLQEVQALLDSRTENAPVPQRAIALLRQVEQADPKQPEALWLLGVAAVQADDKPKAVNYWQRLLAVLPPDGEDAKMVKGALDGLKAK